jgi:hypothetical protein
MRSTLKVAEPEFGWHILRFGTLTSRKGRFASGSGSRATLVGQSVCMPHLQVNVAPIVSSDQGQMNMRDRIPVFAIENAEGDGFVVNPGESSPPSR